MRLCQRADFGLQFAEEGEQFSLMRIGHGFGATDFRFNLADGFFDHTSTYSVISHWQRNLPTPDFRQDRMDDFPDRGADVFDRTRGVDGFDALGFRGHDIFETFSDAREKLLVGFFDTVT